MIKHSEACERNKDPILKILNKEFKHSRNVLEIGSGTGQHAVFFGENLEYLNWQTSELSENLLSLIKRIQLEAPKNVKLPLEIDVSKFDWSLKDIDSVFTANTFHIMSIENVEYFFDGMDKILINGGNLCVYGPFKYNGIYTSESNEKFDRQLKERDKQSGIKDFETVNELAINAGLKLQEDYKMPANNQCIVWKKVR